MYDVIVIGGGVAAQSAVLYLSRFGRKVCWVYGYGFGGKLNDTLEVDNYLGFNGGIALDLANVIEEQIVGLDGVDYQMGLVRSMTDTSVTTDLEETYMAKAILIATGSQPKKLGLEHEEDYSGKGVSYCAICDGPFFKDQSVVVIGGGISAVEEAMILSQYCRNVFLVHRKPEFNRVPKYILEKMYSIPNIKTIMESELKEIKVDGTRVTGVEIKTDKTRANYHLEIAGIFISIGQEPATGFISEKILLDDNGYIMTNESTNQSYSKNNVFVAGDVSNVTEKQFIIAAGDGAKAAIEINKFLSFSV